MKTKCLFFVGGCVCAFAVSHLASEDADKRVNANHGPAGSSLVMICQAGRGPHAHKKVHAGCRGLFLFYLCSPSALFFCCPRAAERVMVHAQAPKSGCCGTAESTYKLFSRQWRKKKETSRSFRLSCGLSWHDSTIFLIKLSSWRIYLFVRRPVTHCFFVFWLKSSNLDYDGFWKELLCKSLAACIGEQRTIPENGKTRKVGKISKFCYSAEGFCSPPWPVYLLGRSPTSSNAKHYFTGYARFHGNSIIFWIKSGWIQSERVLRFYPLA